MSPDASAREIAEAPPVREFFVTLLARLNKQATGSANTIARMRLLEMPPSLDRGEITDKGSINQSAVLTHRAAIVDALYDSSGPDSQVILARGMRD